MRKWLLRSLYVLPILLVAGLARSDYTATQGAGTTVFAFVCSVSKVCPASVLIDSTNVEKATAGNPLRTDPTGTTTQPVSQTSGPWTENLTQVNTVAVLTGTGAVGTGAQRIAVGTDTATIAGSAPGTAGSASSNVLTVQGIASMTALLANPGTAANWGIGTSTQNSATVANGQLALAQFNTTPTTITNGNMSPIQMDSAGNLLVNIKAGAGSGGTAITDKSAWTVSSTNFTLSGGEFTTGGATACATGQACTVGMTAGRAFMMDLSSEGGTAVTSTPTSYGTAPTGNVIGVNAFVTNATALGQAVMGASSPVVIASNQSAIPVNPAAAATGGATPSFVVAANSNNATNLKGSAATVYGIQVYGLGSAPAYLKLYNKATAPTCGSDTPVAVFMIPAASTAANGAGANVTFPVGKAFGTGLGYCVVTGIGNSDNTSVAATTFIVNIDWL